MKDKVIAHIGILLDAPLDQKVGYQDLLRAFAEEGQYVNEIRYLDHQELVLTKLVTPHNNQTVYLPLNYRTIEDIPEDDPCWEQLCKVFGLLDSE